MQWGRQAGRAEQGAATARLDHCHLACPVNLFECANALIEANKIGATTEQHVLAIIDNLVDAWMPIGACATSKIAASLHKLHAKSGLCESAGCTHACHSAADYGHGLVQALAQVARPFSIRLADQSCPRDAAQSQRQNRKLLRERYTYAAGKYVVSATLNSLQQLMVDRHQNP